MNCPFCKNPTINNRCPYHENLTVYFSEEDDIARFNIFNFSYEIEYEGDIYYMDFWSDKIKIVKPVIYPNLENVDISGIELPVSNVPPEDAIKFLKRIIKLNPFL